MRRPERAIASCLSGGVLGIAPGVFTVPIIPDRAAIRGWRIVTRMSKRTRPYDR